MFQKITSKFLNVPEKKIYFTDLKLIFITLFLLSKFKQNSLNLNLGATKHDTNCL